MTVPPSQLVTTALLNSLRTALGTSFPVGDHVAPATPGSQYAILYSLDGGAEWGPPLTASEESVNLPFQITCVGTRRDQAQWLADKVHDLILNRQANGTFTTAIANPAGYVLCGRLSDVAASGVQVEGQAPRRVFSVPRRYILQVTPA